MTVLAGDLGGTKTLLALCDATGQLLHQCQYDSRAHDSLEAMVERFLAEKAVQHLPRPTAAGLGVAGPIVEMAAPAPTTTSASAAIGSVGQRRQRATITNLGYSIDGAHLAARFGLARVELANDFYALALYATRVAQQIEARFLAEGWEAAFATAQSLAVALLVDRKSARPEPQGNLAVLGAGTGLGQAIVVRKADRLTILATEGGHTDFAPRDEVEIDLLRFLLTRHPEHVSVERILCGGGLYTLYEFLAARQPERVAKAVTAELAAAGAAAPAVVSAHALAGSDELCVQAVQRFVMLYGAEASNLALKCLATGGVVIGGGVARKILPTLQDGLFQEHFLRKGRFRSLCQRMPIYVLLDPLAGLRGAAYLVCDRA